MITTLRNPASWLLDWFRGSEGNVPVNANSMLGSAAIWYAMQTISGDVAKMPLDVRRLNADGGSDVYLNHPGYRLLRDEPNNYQTADVFKEQLQAHALGWGNGRAVIVRSPSQAPSQLIPLMPDRTATVMVEGEKYHITMPYEDDPIRFQSVVEEVIDDPRVIETGETIVLHDRDVLHIVGFGYNGVTGLGVADVLRDSIGNVLQAQRYTRNGMKKGFAGKVMLEAPAGVFKNEDDAKKFLDMFRERHSLDKDSETVGMLREGIKANVMNMSNVDAQFIEQQKFGRQDVMLIFGLQHIPGDNSSVSYNSLEQKMLAYLASCLDRWLIRWEMQCDCKLRRRGEKTSGNVYYKFNRGTWLQTDMATTAAVLGQLVQNKILSRNEARDKLDKNPVEGGDKFENPAIQVDGQEETTMKELITVEAKRVVEGTKADDYLAWINKFYSEWQLTLAKSMPRIDSKRYCETRIKQLIDGAGSATKQTIRKVVSELVSDWVSKAKEWL